MWDPASPGGFVSTQMFKSRITGKQTLLYEKLEECFTVFIPFTFTVSPYVVTQTDFFIFR